MFFYTSFLYSSHNTTLFDWCVTNYVLKKFKTEITVHNSDISANNLWFVLNVEYVSIEK